MTAESSFNFSHGQSKYFDAAVKICIGLVNLEFEDPHDQSVLGWFFILVYDDICDCGAVVKKLDFVITTEVIQMKLPTAEVRGIKGV